MNTLKPLMIVAVLAGVGYGVYNRLNRGHDVPPPAVSEGWDTTPKVQLPDQTSSAPWVSSSASPGGTPFGGSAAPPAAQPMPGEAPPFANQQAGGAPGGAAPPFNPAPGSSEAPPFAGAPPVDAVAQAGQPAGNPAEGSRNPFDRLPGEAPAAPPAQNGPEMTVTDPYAESEANAPDRYRNPPGDAAAPPYGAAPENAPPGSMPPPGAHDPNAPPAGTAPGAAPPGTGPEGAPPSGAPSDFATAMATAKRELEAGQMASALRQLSAWYEHPQLTPQDQQQLMTLLDQVAGTVVYSTQHLLEPPYEVQPGERLESIGEKYSVPWQLLAKINGIEDPAALRTGERLKVLRGPFHAVVSLEKKELTLVLADGSYAGRFKIGVGTEPAPQEGTFTVSDKAVNPVYYGRDRAVSADDVNNPLGERWIGLGKAMAIHGTNNPQNIGRADLPGSISLTERDVEDVFDILSLGSKVVIRR